MNTSRRIFRGRAGPTDRQLPKYNARRAKPQRQTEASKTTSKYGNSKLPENVNQQVDEEIEPLEIIRPIEIRNAELNESQRESTGNTGENDAPVDSTANISPCVKELRHLQKRVKNVIESMQLSDSITSPKTYQDNVLNAAANCVNEWRQINNRYSRDEDELPEEKKKQAVSEVFQLIQLSLQCGPLAGSKPGYFKRCGSQVAKVVLDYITTFAPNVDISQALGFTERQAEALETWRVNAQKAVENDKPPSKSQLKKQSKPSKNK
jgi:hypothetical protein